uniref:Uncharacterized protein n=1 Tax=Arundo donax TaxID=35708 RepID=A0A0A9E016_ARUDO
MLTQNTEPTNMQPPQTRKTKYVTEESKSKYLK